MDSNLDFKSCYSNIQHANTILDYVEDALDSQDLFDKNTTPYEKNDFDFEELQSFKIDVDKIDRLYHINYEPIYRFQTNYELIVRMQYDAKPLYVELFGNCCEIHGFRWDGVGHIFISRNADIFMKCVLRIRKYESSKYNIKAIYESLKNDGIRFEAAYESPNNAHTLQKLCYKAISNNTATLQEYKTELPKILIESVNYFIKAKEAIIHYTHCIAAIYYDKK